MTKKRLTILHTESSTGWGGQEIRIFHESLRFTELGYRVLIACQEGSKIAEKAKSAGLPVYIIRIGYPTALLTISKLLRIIKKEKVDIIHTHSSKDSWLASIAARISSRKPVIIRTRHLSTPVSKGLLSRIVYQYLPHLIITTGNSIRDTLISINRFPEDKIVSIPTGVDLDVFYPRPVNNDLREKLGISQDEKAIGTIAVLRSWKGHDYLLEATKILIEKRREIKLVIAGDGPKYNHLLEKSKSIGISDHVLFLRHRDDIPDVLSMLDVVVLPSYANEGVPQSILQAMAMRKPVVASSAGSIPEIVYDKETGILVEPKNPSALAEGIAFMLDNKDFTDKVTANARRLVESKYSLGYMVNRIEEVYNNLMQKYKTRGDFLG